MAFVRELVGSVFSDRFKLESQLQNCRLTQIPDELLSTALLGDRWGIHIMPNGIPPLILATQISALEKQYRERGIRVAFIEDAQGWIMFGDLEGLATAVMAEDIASPFSFDCLERLIGEQAEYVGQGESRG